MLRTVRAGATGGRAAHVARAPVASDAAAHPRLLDVGLLGLAAALWFAPPRLLVLGFPLLAVAWWRRRCALGAAASTPLDPPIALLLVLGMAALVPSVDLSVSLPRLLGLWCGVAVFLVVYDLLTSEKRLWLVVSGLASGSMLLAVVGLVATDWPAALAQAGLLDGVYRRLPRLITFLPGSDEGGLNPNKLAAALAMLLPLPTAVMLFTPGRLLRLYWGSGAALVGATLVLTGSRSGLLAAAAAVLGLAATRSRRCRLVLGLVLALVGLAAAGSALYAGPDAVANELRRLPAALGAADSLADRLAVWSLALSLVQAFPLLGIGIGTFPEVIDRFAPPLVSPLAPTLGVAVPHAHNLYLQFALDLGLPGLGALLALVAGALRLTWRAVRLGPTARARGLMAGVACGLLAYLAYGLTDAIGPGEKPGLFLWLLLGTIAAGDRLAGQGPRTSAPRAADGSPARSSIGSVVYLSSFDWTYHMARPQQLARAFAERLPVLYVETTGLRAVGARDLGRLLRRVRRGVAGRYEAGPNLWVFSPLVLPFHRSRLARAINRFLLRDAVRGQARDLGLAEPLLFISIPTAASIDLVGHLGEAASVYDCMDDLTAIPAVDRSIRASEAELARHVDVMVTPSDALRRLKAPLRQDIAVVGQGVDAAHFARQTACPPELVALPHPLLLCAGGIDERLDFALLDEVARLRPGWSIVLVGPELSVCPVQVPHPNVYRLGRRSYGDLPAYVQAADVCLIPYADTRWARACTPVKTLEYLAAGRPVVSTDVPAVRAYEPLVRIARRAPEFVAAVEAALAEDSPVQQGARRAVAAGAAWTDRADALYELAAAAHVTRRAP